MKMLKKIFTFVFLFSVTFSSIGINTYAKDTSGKNCYHDPEFLTYKSEHKIRFRCFYLPEISSLAALKAYGHTSNLTSVTSRQYDIFNKKTYEYGLQGEDRK